MTHNVLLLLILMNGTGKKNVENQISKKIPCSLFNNNSLPFYLLFDQC